MVTFIKQVTEKPFPNYVEQFLDCVYKNMGKAAIQIAEETNAMLQPYPKPLLELACHLSYYSIYPKNMASKVGKSIWQYLIDTGYGQQEIIRIISTLQECLGVSNPAPDDKCSSD